MDFTTKELLKRYAKLAIGQPFSPVLLKVLGATRRQITRILLSEYALLGVLGSGLLRGVLIGAIISVVQLLRRASRTHVAFLGRIPGTWRFSDMARHSDNEPVPGALLVRVDRGN